MPIDASWGLTESMLIRDKKETEVISKFKSLINRKNIRLNKTFRESKYFRWYSKNRKRGTLLFGDIDIRKDLNQISSFFGGKLNNISVISIPHHGSANNWDIRLFSLINKSFDYYFYREPVIWIVSSGLR
ncbi:hypothetical protein KQI67_23150 [Bacillus albus]|uniref:hypothetical protein n=1 Tax=Bacillus albus TaxID=2026189 RepID=UPI001C11C0F2|nr:hypothetical protein [Bacillus albus]MBU5219560.1 hypothetical protein [Bacillus albus]